MLDIYGYGAELPPDFDQMMYPVRCGHCGAIYDASKVTVLQQYADCSIWKSPCCRRQVDDRQWKPLPDIQPLDRDGQPVRRG